MKKIDVMCEVLLEMRGLPVTKQSRRNLRRNLQAIARDNPALKADFAIRLSPGEAVKMRDDLRKKAAAKIGRAIEGAGKAQHAKLTRAQRDKLRELGLNIHEAEAS